MKRRTGGGEQIERRSPCSRGRGGGGGLPDLSCLIRPLLVVVLTGRKSLNQEMSGSGLPLAAQSMVAVRVRSTTFNWGPMSMVGKPGGSWSSAQTRRTLEKLLTRQRDPNCCRCRETLGMWETIGSRSWGTRPRC